MKKTKNECFVYNERCREADIIIYSYIYIGYLFRFFKSLKQENAKRRKRKEPKKQKKGYFSFQLVSIKGDTEFGD